MLALRPGWASMFRSYLNAPERYAKCFVTDESGDDWYISGDLASIDTDGYVWFVGRADDVIKTSGHLVGPFEIESVLGEHPAVAASGSSASPTKPSGRSSRPSSYYGQVSNRAKRHVVISSPTGVVDGPGRGSTRIGFRGESAGHPKRQDHATPPSAPRELGLPEGDLSTLEGSDS